MVGPSEDALPPVERVGPGLWSIPVPLPNTSLRYVLVYAFETDRGPFLIDAGWDTDEAFAALSAGLGVLGTEMCAVQGVMVTHIHPDHYGLAGRIREVSGAWVGLHPADAELIKTRYVDPTDLLARMREYLRAAGAPGDEAEELMSASMPVRPFVYACEPDLLLEDGDRPEVPGWSLQALWTPGHSPGHLCFWEERRQLLFSGDHVLPRITPNVSLHPQSQPDPLGAFLRSLDAVAELPADEVLPAHEYRFTGLTGRVRDIQAHHDARMREILGLLAGGPGTAWEVAAGMRWSRPWDQIVGFTRRAAVAEALAHLDAMWRRGSVTKVDGPPTRWVVAPA